MAGAGHTTAKGTCWIMIMSKDMLGPSENSEHSHE